LPSRITRLKLAIRHLGMTKGCNARLPVVDDNQPRLTFQAIHNYAGCPAATAGSAAGTPSAGRAFWPPLACSTNASTSRG
jgi:hypothetical protein